MIFPCSEQQQKHKKNFRTLKSSTISAEKTIKSIRRDRMRIIKKVLKFQGYLFAILNFLFLFFSSLSAISSYHQQLTQDSHSSRCCHELRIKVKVRIVTIFQVSKWERREERGSGKCGGGEENTNFWLHERERVSHGRAEVAELKGGLS